MALKANFPLGFIKKSRGLKGELLLNLVSPTVEFDKRIGCVWLGETLNEVYPWKVGKLYLQGSSAFLKLRDVNTREEADFLKGLKVFIPSSWIHHDHPLRLYGYRVIEHSRRITTAVVTNVDLSGNQPNLIITAAQGEFILPLVADFVSRIDQQRKIIYIKLLEGMEPQ
jgi:ribosomal 30S subunit maturation factor RimM